MFTAACCFGGGFLVAAFGVSIHNLWLIYLGYGVLGGCGLGIGYISPVKTLITWFPDRPGMATGMAIMGFGGGAMIASPLSVLLMGAFSSPTHVGVMETFVVLGIVYFCFMSIGAIIVRVPPVGWHPEGYVAPAQSAGLITTENVHVATAWRTPQFWLLWWVLCLNVTAGIGVLGQASAMAQEMFPGRITAVAAAGFVGLLSIFNMAGGSSGPQPPTIWGGRTPTACSFCWGCCCTGWCRLRAYRQRGAVRDLLPDHHQHVWWRVFHHSGVSEGRVRRAVCRRDSRAAADGMVRRRACSGRSS